MDMVRQALPMVMSFLKMAMVICIPMVLVIGTYQLKVAMTMTVVFFAMMFVDFWFQLARYIDSTILDAFYGSGSPHLSFDPVMGLNTATQDAILNFVMGAMFVILPMLWITAIGWAGVQVGALLSDLSNGVKGVQQAGVQGGSVAKQAISSFSPKGIDRKGLKGPFLLVFTRKNSIISSPHPIQLITENISAIWSCLGFIFFQLLEDRKVTFNQHPPNQPKRQ